MSLIISSLIWGPRSHFAGLTVIIQKHYSMILNEVKDHVVLGLWMSLVFKPLSSKHIHAHAHAAGMPNYCCPALKWLGDYWAGTPPLWLVTTLQVCTGHPHAQVFACLGQGVHGKGLKFVEEPIEEQLLERWRPKGCSLYTTTSLLPFRT